MSRIIIIEFDLRLNACGRYSDLGSFYVDGYRLPPEYQYTLTKRRTVDADNGNPVM